ncbi:hypothetical protein [Streptomyces californicus]|uniref:hypothetical protein n=1 Tax=Streptomyces californicus TaxID=67351 RepID=UPI00296FD9E2|nr:hypothetical protein [Streptomyces californicus]MDW4912478.1 hypothetical protein [Streptomyces californicus]
MTTPWDDATHPAWLALSARTGDWLSTVSERGDVIAVVHPGAPESKYAEFYPALAEGRFAPDQLLDGQPDPALIDPNAWADRCAHPAFAGAICHEAAHAKHTTFAPTRQHSASAVRWATILEEPRIEHRLIQDRPGDRAWLRASTRHVLLTGVSGGHEDKSVPGAVHQAVLILGRAAGGVLEADEVQPVTRQVTEVLGDAVMGELNDVFRELFELDDDDQDGLLALGARVAHLAQDDADDDQQNGEESGSGQSQGGAGQDGRGTGSPSGGTGQGGSGDAEGGPNGSDAITVMMPCGAVTWGDPTQAENGSGGSGSDGDGDDDSGQEGTPSVAERVVDQIVRDAVASAHAKIAVILPKRPDYSGRQAAQKAAQNVFTGGGVGFQQIKIQQVKPTANQQRQARALLNALSKAQYRDVNRTTRAVSAPPGRMVMREVVRREAQIRARTEVSALPWQRTSRRQEENPPLTVGISLDVSGSMGPWIEPVASTGWALAHAVASPRLAGTVASAAWNGWNPSAVATGLIKPGKRPLSVPVPNMGGGSDGCGQSLYALDGALNLTGKSGARVAVVITDGDLPNQPDVQRAADHLTRSGVLLLWLSVKDGGWAPKGAHVEYLSDPKNFGPIVGRALARALTSA